ncbi:MAG: hypothetical protein H6571_21225 [Lewinellaceae bacterium]|nr:hypothetical protein [Lewinellaceae bacterium]
MKRAIIISGIVSLFLVFVVTLFYFNRHLFWTKQHISQFLGIETIYGEFEVLSYQENSIFAGDYDDDVVLQFDNKRCQRFADLFLQLESSIEPDDTFYEFYMSDLNLDGILSLDREWVKFRGDKTKYLVAYFDVNKCKLHYHYVNL